MTRLILPIASPANPETILTHDDLAALALAWLTNPNGCAMLEPKGDPSMAQPDNPLRTRLRTPEPDPDPWRALVLAVILQAVKDAHGSRPGRRHDAQDWLNGPACAHLCIAVDIDHAELMARVSHHCQPRRRKAA